MQIEETPRNCSVTNYRLLDAVVWKHCVCHRTEWLLGTSIEPFSLLSLISPPDFPHLPIPTSNIVEQVYVVGQAKYNQMGAIVSN